jgi:hypothetical protein
MARLITTPNVAHPDDLYEMLIELHSGLDDTRSTVVNAKLIMLLLNHVGDVEVIQEAFRIARKERVVSDPRQTGGAEL